MARRLFKLFMILHVFIYRRTKGGIWNHMRGMPVLLLTTTGRKTGQKRTVPLMYMTDGENYVITASNNGSDKDPAWWTNLKSNPQAQIEVLGAVKAIVASQANPQDKQRLWAELVSKAAFFDAYQKGTTRDIPLVILKPV